MTERKVLKFETELKNGAIVIDAFLLDVGHGEAPCQVVLAHHPEKKEWITWLYNEETKGCFLGHYFDNIKDATTDYFERIKRG